MARRRWQEGTVYLEGDTWKGRFLEDVVSLDGSTRRVYRKIALGTLDRIPSKSIARRMLKPHIDRVNSIHYRPRADVKFSEFAAHWLKVILASFKPSTQASIRSVLRHRLIPFLGPYQLAEINLELLQRFISTLQGQLNPKTIRNCIVSLRSVWREAVNWGYAEDLAFRRLRLPARIHSERPWFTAEQIRLILRAAPEPYRTFYWLLAETGLRAGEAAALEWENLDLFSGVLQVNTTAGIGGIQLPKSQAGVRSLAISAQLVKMLSAVKRNGNGEAPVFLSALGKRMRPDLVVKRKLKPLCKQVGIEWKPGMGLHSFRHFNATMMAHAGIPIKTAQQRLGHADPNVTLGYYTHALREDEKPAAETLAGILITPVSANLQ
jgi:integrase